MPLRVGFVGLGIMGSAYARHVIEAGFPTVGYDIAAEAMRDYQARGGVAATSAKAVAAQSEVVIASLASSAAVEAAFFGENGIAAGAGPGLIVLETGTFALDVKERVRAGLAKRQTTVLDTPVSGTGSQAQNKDLVFFASGERAAYDRALPVMAAVSREVRYLGEYGNGSKFKYVANLLVTIHNVAAAEAIVLAQKCGLDLDLVVNVISESAATSRMFQVRAPMMVTGTYEPATARVQMFDKDIHIIGAFAKSVDCPVPLFSESSLFYAAALAEGRGEQDAASVASVLRAQAGLPADR